MIDDPKSKARHDDQANEKEKNPREKSKCKQFANAREDKSHNEAREQPKPHLHEFIFLLSNLN